jgi:hypothetical protein
VHRRPQLVQLSRRKRYIRSLYRAHRAARSIFGGTVFELGDLRELRAAAHALKAIRV